MRVLYCDPSSKTANNKALLRLQYGDCPGAVLRETELDNPRSEVLLKTMTELIGAEPLDALVLVNQAESFTLVRVLATLYNALAYSRNVPLYELTTTRPFSQLAKDLGQPVQQIHPHYNKAPNITYAAQSR